MLALAVDCGSIDPDLAGHHEQDGQIRTDRSDLRNRLAIAVDSLVKQFDPLVDPGGHIIVSCANCHDPASQLAVFAASLEEGRGRDRETR